MKYIKQRLHESHSVSQFIPTGNSTVYGDALNRIEELETERDQLREQVKTLQSAIKNLRDVKGRHHSEIAYKRLIEALVTTEPKE